VIIFIISSSSSSSSSSVSAAAARRVNVTAKRSLRSSHYNVAGGHSTQYSGQRPTRSEAKMRSNDGTDRLLSEFSIIVAVIVRSLDNDVLLRRAAETPWNRNQRHRHRIRRRHIELQTSIVVAVLLPPLSPSRHADMLNIGYRQCLLYALTGNMLLQLTCRLMYTACLIRLNWLSIGHNM